MLKDFTDYRVTRDKAHYLHFSLAMGADQRIDFPYFFDTFAPGRRRDIARFIIGYRNNGTGCFRHFDFSFGVLLFGFPEFAPHPV